MNAGSGDLQAEVERLRKELERSQREVRQIRTVARTSQELATQSKRAMFQANLELERTILRLKEATRAAEEASEAKSRFLAAMSHEIRTPMNGVLGSLELIRALDVSPEVGELLGLMNDSARALLVLINDILDFAKVEANSLVLERAAFSIRDCIDGVVAQEISLATRKGVAIRVDVSGDVPHVVEGDPFRLRQVLSNLVSNAVKFTAEGWVRIRARVECEERIRFEVLDTGMGIEEGALEHIFAPFTQADSSTTRLFGGTGLGLSISSGLVALMGGELSVTSELGHGSTFGFSVPLAVLEADSVGSAIPASATRGPLRQFDARVLVVDDTPLNLLIAERMLQRMGCRVEARANGREAVEAVASEGFDLVLMDCSMPVMDGYEATAAIRELPGAAGLTPIVALTAHAMAGIREQCLAAGMDDYVAKPMQLAELEAALARHLQPHGARS